ncbi:hypothetical protein ACHAW6_003324 [Cyclotella cf. meneghiniana]
MQARTGTGSSTSQNLEGVVFPAQGGGNLGKALTSYDVANGKNSDQELLIENTYKGNWQ